MGVGAGREGLVDDPVRRRSSTASWPTDLAVLGRRAIAVAANGRVDRRRHRRHSAGIGRDAREARDDAPHGYLRQG